MKKRMLFHVILLLTLTWGGFSGCDNGEDIVTPPEVDTPLEVEIEPDSPSPEEQLAGLYDLIRFDYAGDFFDRTPPLEPPIATGTLVMFEGDSFSMKWEVEDKDGGGVSIQMEKSKWEASTTKIFLDEVDAFDPESISYTWQGTILILKVRMRPDWPARGAAPREHILVWKKTQ